MRASSNVRVVKGSSSPSSRSSSSGVSHCLWLGAYLVWVEIKSYEAPPDVNSASICSLRSGCVGATTVSTLRPWISSNSARRVYRGSYIGPPTSRAFKRPFIRRSLLCGRRRLRPAFCDGSAAIRPASAPQHHVGQACSPLREVRGGASEARLEVVGPKHQRYKVEGTVRLETRHQVSPAVHVIPLYGIIPHRRPARQAFFDHTIFLTQPHPEHPRPAYVLGKALPRLGVRAPGVRVPVTQYRSHLIPSRSEDTNSLSALST